MSNNTFIVFLKGKGNNKLYYPTAIKKSDYLNKHEYLKNHILEIGNEHVTLGQKNNSINCNKIQFKLKKGNGIWKNIKCVSVLNKKLHIIYKDGREENINFSRLSIRSKDLSSSYNAEGYTTNENFNSSNEKGSTTSNNFSSSKKEKSITKLLNLKPLGKLEKPKYKSKINETELNKFFDISTNYKSKIQKIINDPKRQKEERNLMGSENINYNRKKKENNVKKAKILANKEEANKIAREKLEESKRIKNEKNAKYKTLMSKVQNAKKLIKSKFKEESIRLAREAKQKEEEANRIAKEEANRIAKEAKKLAIEAKKLANEVKRLANEKNAYIKLQEKYLKTPKNGLFEIKKIDGITFDEKKKKFKNLIKTSSKIFKPT